MNKWVKVLSVLLVFCVQSFALANYTYRDGYYWYNGVAYNRVQEKYYDSYRCGWYYRWNYSKADVANVSYKDDNWKSKLIEIAKERQEHKEFLEAVKLLGLEGSVPTKGYRSYYESSYDPNVPYAKQGSSVTGYNETVQQYGTVEPMVLYNQSERLTINSQTAGDRARAGHQALIDAELERIAEEKANLSLIKQIQVEGQVRKELMEASRPNASYYRKVEVQSEKSNSEQPVADPPTPEPPANGDDALAAFIEKSCVGCHNAQKPSGKIDMTKYFAFNAEQRQLVEDAITNPDPEKRMPLAKDAAGDVVPGKPLTFSELMLFHRGEK